MSDYRKLAAKLQAALDAGATEITVDLRYSAREPTTLTLNRAGARDLVTWLCEQPEDGDVER